jgi:hypothetical protein
MCREIRLRGHHHPLGGGWLVEIGDRCAGAGGFEAVATSVSGSPSGLDAHAPAIVEAFGSVS